MPRTSLLSSALLLAALASPALADGPEVRDHRTAPVVTSGSTTSVHYRKRPGPRIMAPLKIDLGATGVNTSRGFAPGIAGAIGIHWASLSPEPTDTDIGIGLFGAIHGAPAMDGATDPGMDENNTVAYGGAYLEGAHTLSRGDWWRTWGSVRGEYLGSTAFGEETKTGFGVSGRLSAELYASGVGVEPRGVFLGTYAIGVYVEAGLRDVVSDVGKFQASAGLTFRTPLVFAF